MEKSELLVELSLEEQLNIAGGAFDLWRVLGDMVGTNTSICRYNAQDAPWVGQAFK